MSRSTQRTDIPIYQRYSITVDEAAAYFMIGENRLRELVKCDRYADYLLWVGTTVRIKREQFEKFLDKTNFLDFENNIISINHNLIYRQADDGKCGYTITTPKTKAGIREIPMFEEVREALLSEYERQKEVGFNEMVIDGYSGFVFRNRFGSKQYLLGGLYVLLSFLGCIFGVLCGKKLSSIVKI